jgi:hypothetical protein
MKGSVNRRGNLDNPSIPPVSHPLNNDSEHCVSNSSRLENIGLAGTASLENAPLDKLQ